MKTITLFLSDHLMKATASKDLLRAVREAFKGNSFLPGPPIAERSSKPLLNRDLHSKATAGPALTGRQTEVLKLIGEGYSNKEISGVLSLSIKTVEKHRQLVMNKLDIHDIATLTRYAVSSGVVESKTCAELVGSARRRKRGGRRSLQTRLGRTRVNLDVGSGKRSRANGRKLN